MSDKVLASMPPGMVRTLRMIAHYPDAAVHGPVLKGLTTRGLVRHTGNQLAITWAGQKVINELEKHN